MVSSQISHPSHFVNAELLNSIDFPRLFKYWDKHPPSLCEAVLLSCRQWVSSQWMEEGYKCALRWRGLANTGPETRLMHEQSYGEMNCCASSLYKPVCHLVPDFQRCQDSQKRIKLGWDKHNIWQRHFFCRTEPVETLRMKQITLAVPPLICLGVSPNWLHCSDGNYTTE